ncbi:MAG: RICIN domain-containing protein, partial [Zetaproteobacteria bacterium]|nr:RICIN domain-containing protein [Zetaproteobacteria bacterium]
HCQQRNEMFALHGERRGEQDCFQIISAWSGKALDVAIPYHDGAAVHTWTPHGGDRQRWVIEEVREEERS